VTSVSTSTGTDPKAIRNTSDIDISTISDTKMTANGLAQHASDVAREVADTVYDESMPIESDSRNSSGGEEQPWYERYSTHITIGSTVIGLGTFMIWLAVRKK
jgi:hypothetical protein